jgi:LmbE family N-acetylglucosaminyl deacetylase
MRNALILVAHADDETLGSGGLIQKLVRDDWNVDVVSCPTVRSLSAALSKTIAKMR